MALIRDSKPRKTSGGYLRLFNDTALGYLMSRVQSAVIASGNELEKIIRGRANHVDDLDKFLNTGAMPTGVFVADKRDVKKCQTLDFAGAEPDFVVFKKDGETRQHCYLIELKDGDAFDTKKASGERQLMQQFMDKNSRHLPFTVSAHFCCFNQDDKSAIVRGFKRKINPEEAMTGREFCDLLELDYDAIVKQRQEAVSDNLPYFLSELVKIEAVQNWLKKHYG